MDDLRASFAILRIARRGSAAPIKVNVPRSAPANITQDKPALFVFLARESTHWDPSVRKPDHRRRAKRIAKKTWATTPPNQRPKKYEVVVRVVAGSAIKGFQAGDSEEEDEHKLWEDAMGDIRRAFRIFVLGE